MPQRLCTPSWRLLPQHQRCIRKVERKPSGKGARRIGACTRKSAVRDGSGCGASGVSEDLIVARKINRLTP
ncbi:unnamed protein product, partial [Ectocarpus sp. 4 AP-2014]